MALLTADTLLNCSFIPDFISSGTKMIFENSSAPTSWTRDTTPNDATLRVISGTVSSNLSNQTFSTVFSNRSISYTVSPSPSGTITVNSSPAGVSLQPATPPTSVDSVDFGLAAHTHTPLQFVSKIQRRTGSQAQGFISGTTVSTGGGGSHTHGGASGSPHTHPITDPTHTHPVTDTAHNHTSSSVTQDFRISYKDFILATKD